MLPTAVTSTPSAAPSVREECRNAWAYHPTSAIALQDIGYNTWGFTNGVFDLYACGLCDCPVCSSGGPLCERPEAPLAEFDKCTCVCPKDGYEDPGEIMSPKIAASVTSPITMYLYAAEDDVAGGSQLGENGVAAVGIVTLALKDRKMTITLTSDDSFFIDQSNLYIGEDRLPTASRESPVTPSSLFPLHGNNTATNEAIFSVQLSTYNFYIAAHVYLCDVEKQPTSTPTESTETPSFSPSESVAPSSTPSNVPTGTLEPSTNPTRTPTGTPVSLPTTAPTVVPTRIPTTKGPTAVPTTEGPTTGPTDDPTQAPTEGPTQGPTEGPTQRPTTVNPTVSSGSPSAAPTTGSPTFTPTGAPTTSPTGSPTGAPTGSPTASPTGTPTGHPTGSTGTPTGSHRTPREHPQQAQLDPHWPHCTPPKRQLALPLEPPPPLLLPAPLRSNRQPYDIEPNNLTPTVASGHPSAAPTTGTPTDLQQALLLANQQLLLQVHHCFPH
ncbi:Inherit from NOG: Serine repeat antigen [Seminavis robusta]|uniref:Inherit from NOG: Serine repeat antigen n=1 Tax=Seminavis robusta TaxID=568900 RepID=A0A9N8ESY9_9STRA|nr:Inherit from NOG: Serine repeat antigen [Seminavis robusta]|eukprot:Sro1609_g285740.1 Inherit from NOG: Serine repeat antigen (496) ;mRNA; f:11830-13317